MATGYWIVKGDRTSCGGTVHEGAATGSFANNYVALNGSKVSCGKHPGTFIITGGHPGHINHGVYEASTLYSRSSCPCRAFFIPSQTWAKHGPYQDDPAPLTVFSSSGIAEPEQHAQSAGKKAASEADDAGKTPREKREVTLTLRGMVTHGIQHGREAQVTRAMIIDSEPFINQCHTLC